MKHEPEARQILDNLDTYLQWHMQPGHQHAPTTQFLQGMRAGLAWMLEQPQACFDPTCQVDHERVMGDNLGMVEYMAETIRRQKARVTQ